MAKLSMGSNPDLAKVHKSGDLKYWPSFWMMVRDKTPFKKGAQGKDGMVIIGYKTPTATKKLVAEMAKCTTSREVLTFLNSKNAEFPTTDGGTVKVTELWKENVKESKPQTTTKVGGRSEEHTSELQSR